MTVQRLIKMLQNSPAKSQVGIKVKGGDGKPRVELDFVTVIEDTTVKPSVVYLYCAKKPVL